MGRLIGQDLYSVKGMRAATEADGTPIKALLATSKGFVYKGIGDRMLYVVAPSIETGELTVVTPRGRDTADGRESVHKGDRALKRGRVAITGEHQLRLSADGVGAVDLDLSRTPQGQPTRAALHKGEVWGFVLSEADEYVRNLTGRPDASLVRIDPTAPRVVGPGMQRSSLASDSQPYSFGNRQSLSALHDLRPGSDVQMVTYRPNMSVDELGGRGPFAEHEAKRLAIGDVEFRVAAGIIRCIVTTMDEGGQPGAGGLSLLRPRLGVRVGDKDARPEPIFCVSLIPELEPGQEVSVPRDAPVEVLEWGPSNVAIRGEV